MSFFRSGKRLFIGPQFLPIYNLKSMQAKTQRDFQLQLLPIWKNGQRNFCFVRYPFLLIFISMIKKQILRQISVETSHTDNITKNSLFLRKGKLHLPNYSGFFSNGLLLLLSLFLICLIRSCVSASPSILFFKRSTVLAS